MAEKHADSGSEGPSALEIISASIGVVVTAAILGIIGWEAITTDGHAVPDLAIDADRASPVGSGYVVELVARNRSEQTAAAVEVEGELKQGDTVVETARATIDYVPAHSQGRAGLIFTRDPAGYRLEVRPTGYQEP